MNDRLYDRFKLKICHKKAESGLTGYNEIKHDSSFLTDFDHIRNKKSFSERELQRQPDRLVSKHHLKNHQIIQQFYNNKAC